jgi:hypothetical protein
VKERSASDYAVDLKSTQHNAKGRYTSGKFVICEVQIKTLRVPTVALRVLSVVKVPNTKGSMSFVVHTPNARSLGIFTASVIKRIIWLLTRSRME